MSCSSCPARAALNIDSPDANEFSEPGCGKLSSHDWLENIPGNQTASNLVEVRFKNTRKEFFINENNITLKRGDYVAVEAARGHDIGQVTLMGRLAELQLNRKNQKNALPRKIYRKASTADIEKWHKTRLRERPVLIKARQLASSLNLEMKISDVEFQGDASRAIFYYIAEGRVDFRELIKLYAKQFSTRIEMKQIGSRQEAALVGGIGSCGKELCCSSWRTDLSTVLTSAAKIQELPQNAQKLTGQCGKLKCCLMYELDTYLEAKKDFPDVLLELETDDGTAFPIKKDILKKTIYYTVGNKNSSSVIPLSLDRVKEIIQLNKKGIKADKLSNDVAESSELKFISHEEKDPSKLMKKKAEKRKKPRNRSKRIVKR